jgi:hypothetical protein
MRENPPDTLSLPTYCHRSFEGVARGPKSVRRLIVDITRVICIQLLLVRLSQLRSNALKPFFGNDEIVQCCIDDLVILRFLSNQRSLDEGCQWKLLSWAQANADANASAVDLFLSENPDVSDWLKSIGSHENVLPAARFWLNHRFKNTFGRFINCDDLIEDHEPKPLPTLKIVQPTII